MTLRYYKKDGHLRARLELVFGWAEWIESDQAMVGDRLVPRSIEVFAVGGAESTEPVLRLLITIVDGVPRCSLLSLERRENGRGIQGADLRAIRLDDWVEEVVAAASWHVRSVEDGQVHATASDDDQAIAAARRAVREMQRKGRRKMTPEHLAKVATVYRDHEKTGKPTQAVEIAFGVPQRTAARWVHLAREEDLL
jgi:hypothetical protein